MNDKQCEVHVGELVDITIRGAKVEEISDMMVHLSYGSGCATGIHFAVNGVTVERVAPADWPPVAGDVWRDHHGAAWFAFLEPATSDGYGTISGPRLVLRPSRPTSHFARGLRPDELLERFGPLALAHREPQAEQDEEV